MGLKNVFCIQLAKVELVEWNVRSVGYVTPLVASGGFSYQFLLTVLE